MNNVIIEIQKWGNEGYLDDKAWDRLKQCVALEGLRNWKPVMVGEETPKVDLLSNTKAAQKGVSKKEK